MDADAIWFLLIPMVLLLWFVVMRTVRRCHHVWKEHREYGECWRECSLCGRIEDEDEYGN